MLRHSTIVCALLLLCGSARSDDTCANWSSAFGLSGTSDLVSATTVFDDGSGPKLIVAGFFEVAGDIPAKSIAAWDGAHWSTLGAGFGVPGLGQSVNALAVWNGELYAGGDISASGVHPLHHVARWNGTDWVDVGGGTNGVVDALVVHEGKLFAAGSFTTAGGAGGVTVNRIAVFDGVSWSAVGNGVNGSEVFALVSVAEPSGNALYAGGSFTSAGGTSASAIARWDGTAWSSLDGGVFGSVSAGVSALAVHDDGTGAQLYVAGGFDHAGSAHVPTQGIARWNGSVWSSVGTTTPFFARTLRSFNIGGVPRLAAGGTFSSILSYDHVRAWDGTNWNLLGSGLSNDVLDLAEFGGELIAVGAFDSSGTLAALHVARWNGVQWRPIDTGAGLSSFPTGLAVHDLGQGRQLFAFGGVEIAGTELAGLLANWNGDHWTGHPDFGFAGWVMGSGPITSFDDGTGARLFAAAWRDFNPVGFSQYSTTIVAWDGTNTEHVIPSPDGATQGQVSAFGVYDDGTGPGLYAGGFQFEILGTNSPAIARYDGRTWSGVAGGIGGHITSMCTFDDGHGAALYVGGAIATAGTASVRGIARWDGTSWSGVGSGFDGPSGIGEVLSLAVHDDGSGPALYAGGYLTAAGGVPLAGIARWNGVSWSSVGGGVSGGYGTVAALASFDDGGGSALYAGGYFTHAGGVPVKYLARWRAGAWSDVDGGLEPRPTGGPTPLVVQTMCVYDDGHSAGSDLYIGGELVGAGDHVSYGIARLAGCADAGSAFCFGDGSGAACPCANNGATGHGCENSAATGGAVLTATGGASLSNDTLSFTSSHELPSVLSIFLQGDASIGAVPFGDGLRCAGGHLKRLYAHNASGGVVTAPQGFDLPVSARSSALGDTIPVGATRVYQVYYRDSNLGFCPSPMGSSFNVSSALSIQWGR
jgi:hypothetical protein